MSIDVAIEHRTTYRFDRSVRLDPHVVRLRPAPHCRTPIRAYSLRCEPDLHFLNWLQDPFGNFEARFVFPEPAEELTFTVELIADMTVVNPFDFFVEESARRYPFAYGSDLLADLAPYLRVGEPGPREAEWLAALGDLRGGDVGIVDFLVGVNQRLQADIGYAVRLEPGVQTPEETLAVRVGSCRDTGWLLVNLLRHLGLAARFASGYLVQLRADDTPVDGPAGPVADFTDLHAWAEVFVPGAGWIGLDPTSGLFAGEGHIPLACTPEPTSAAPVVGAIEPCEVTLEYSNEVVRIREDPRVTLPYSPYQWERIEALGRSVDARLVADDVRLTMGGEPTFVSADDMQAEEWKTAADGPQKRRQGADLARRLAGRFGTGALLQHGQGKWYPGEPLPRWQTEVIWRADGVPVWRDLSLLADPPDPYAELAASLLSPGAADAEVGAGRRLLAQVADALGIPHDCILAAYEDPLAELAAQARLPYGDPPAHDVDPTDPAMAHRDARAGLIAAIDAGAGRPRGWVLPLHRPWGSPTGSWASSRWQLRRGKLCLTPGSSPLGLRLPLDAVSWNQVPQVVDRAAFAAAEPLLARTPRVAASGTVLPGTVVPGTTAPSTALCAEVRNGTLCVFLPPVTEAADALALIAAIEDAAAAIGRPVAIEGYPVPSHPGLGRIVVAPDPGVLEVNVHPAASWDDLDECVTGLYEDAKQAHLGAETFDLDGSHFGTGGGSHLTIGGATPADSPVLRRPDLLVSMLTFWQHHPALSYTFAGRFVGPTSQAPRVDEGRADAVAELGIAFAELDRLGGDPRPWLVDRLLRHLLVDLTGNTHRAEFCIDKLYSPDSERGRLGLVELRGFEMPPHPQMALVQALLVRALIARFWRTPYRGRLVEWGRSLHDRFLLPWYAAADLDDVVADLNRHGLAFDRSWLAPFLEFRFPRLGSVTVGEVTLELRRAIEPWHVLGEEATGNGTARYVDSSVERLEVRTIGLEPSRYVVTCNGHPVPLRATDRPGVHVAGVRYRAWAPPSALHPTIGVHSPLTFDIIDCWSDRSLGGCTYHVVHPGGRNYDRFPANANEAEARRRSRFAPIGHTPGPVDARALAAELAMSLRDHPYTLDLRTVDPGR